MTGYPFAVLNFDSLDLSAYSSIHTSFASFGNDVFDVRQGIYQLKWIKHRT